MKTTKHPTTLSIKGTGNWKPSQHTAGWAGDVLRRTTPLSQNGIETYVFMTTVLFACAAQARYYAIQNSQQVLHFRQASLQHIEKLQINTTCSPIHDKHHVSEFNSYAKANIFSFILFLSRFSLPLSPFVSLFLASLSVPSCSGHSTVLDITSKVSWSDKPYWLENSYWRFGESGCLHLHSHTVQEVCLSLFILRVTGNTSRYYVGKCRAEKGTLSHYCVSKSYTATKSTTFRDPNLQLTLLSFMCFGTK